MGGFAYVWEGDRTIVPNVLTLGIGDPLVWRVSRVLICLDLNPFRCRAVEMCWSSGCRWSWSQMLYARRTRVLLTKALMLGWWNDRLVGQGKGREERGWVNKRELG